MRDVHAGKGIKKSHLAFFTGNLLVTLEDHQDRLTLTAGDTNAIYSRIALEADEIPGEGNKGG